MHQQTSQRLQWLRRIRLQTTPILPSDVAHGTPAGPSLVLKNALVHWYWSRISLAHLFMFHHSYVPLLNYIPFYKE